MSDGLFGTLLITAAVLVDVVANICLKKSNGFKHKTYGFGALFLVGCSFMLLAKAITVIDLSIAYSLFGAFGILITTVIDKIFFGLQVRALGVCGIITMITGIVLVKTI